MATVRLKCNDCGTERQGSPGASVEDLRQLLRQVGWTSNSRLDVDRCGTCS